MTRLKTPLPIFDVMDYIKDQSLPLEFRDPYSHDDFQQAKSFLLSYTGSEGTFNAYRREVERLLHWSWVIAKKPIKELKRENIENYLKFCASPPISWIGIKVVARFINQHGQRIPNAEWRPFVAKVSKSEYRDGKTPNPKNYELSQTALKEVFAILSTFYNFLIQENYTEINPILHIRQKSKYLQQKQTKPKIRRLSELQWYYVIETAEIMANREPELHERTLFIITALYAMYLRISELAANKRWMPKMCDFWLDHDGAWWFTTVGKGNKERQITVSKAMLAALKRYRRHLGLSPLPSPNDKTPLIPKIKGRGPVSDTSHIRQIVQRCFDEAIDRLKNDAFEEDAQALREATVHWLRHTGISDDVKHRPREHVRDDAGHSSSITTDKYIDVELRARNLSGKGKPLKPNI